MNKSFKGIGKIIAGIPILIAAFFTNDVAVHTVALALGAFCVADIIDYFLVKE